MAPQNTDFGQLSTNELVKCVNQQTSFTILKGNENIMHKSSITGYTLVHCGTSEAFKEEGLSCGTRSVLLKLR